MISWLAVRRAGWGSVGQRQRRQAGALEASCAPGAGRPPVCARPWDASSSCSCSASAARLAHPRSPVSRELAGACPRDASAYGSGSGSATTLAQANVSGSIAQSVARTDVSR